MKFVLIVDNTTTNQSFLNAVYQKITSLQEHCDDVIIDTFIIHNGKPLDSDTQLLLEILGNEKQRCPLLVDSKTAKFFPEILKLQTSIVIFEHEQNRNLEVNEYNTFNETIAASHGARIDYIDTVFHDMENNKSLSVVDIQKHLATFEYYVYLAKIYEREHAHYPCILLPCSVQQECKNSSELIKAFEKRLEHHSEIGWQTTAPKEQFDDVDKILHDCCDIAIHSLTDGRLQVKQQPLHIKKV